MKMHRIALSLATALSAAAAMPALAEDSPHEISANVSLTNDYRFRGISQTDEGPALQGGFDYAYTPADIYVGVWGSNVDSSAAGYDGASLEVDFYFGWAPSFGNLGLDVGFLRYMYPNSDVDEVDTNEYHIGASYDFGMAAPSFTINYSDDWFGLEEAWYYDLSVDVPLPMEASLSLHYGWSDLEGDDADYEDWSIGVSKTVGPVDLGLSYVDTDIDGECGGPFQCDGAFVVSVGASF